MANTDRSRLFASFHIAGFQFWEGALVLDRLKTGKKLKLVPEPGNAYDPNAVSLWTNPHRDRMKIARDLAGSIHAEVDLERDREERRAVQ